MRVPKLLTVTLLQTRQRPVPNPIRQRQSSSRLARFPRFEATALTQNRTSLDPARQDGNPAASSSLTTLTIVHSELGSDALVKALEKGKFRRLHFCRPRHLGTAYQAMEHERVVAGRKLPLTNLLEPAFVSKQKEVRERARPRQVRKGHPRYLTVCLLTVGWRFDRLCELTYGERFNRSLPGGSKSARRLRKIGTKCKKDTI